jgi:hypothetical protein
MSDKKISQLTPGSTLVGTEPIPMVQGGQTVATTPNAISALIKPYKVYTALLTQSGGDEGYVIGQSDPIHLGFTYTINSNPDSFDLIQYGAPNNNVGTSFVCNVESYLPTGIDVALAYNLGAPVVTVLENTIGNIWFTYNNVGYYDLNSNGLFLDGKSYPEAEGVNLNTSCFTSWSKVDNNIFRLFCRDLGSIPSDDLLNNTPIEIRVYNY